MRSAFAPALVTCPPELQPALRVMLDELDAQRLTVGLIPAPEQRHCGHCVRAVFGANPSWYKDLAASYQRRRRPRAARFVDPLFKRGDVARTLRRLLTAGTRSYLAAPLLSAAQNIMQREYAQEVPF